MRQALSYAERELEIDQLLLRQELGTAGGDLFLDRYGQLINLSASGQLALRRVFEAHLRRIEWGTLPFPVRLFPFVVAEATDSRPILIDPEISFGRPVVTGAFISTQAILDRIDAGESVEDLARDYGLATGSIEGAVLFERAA